MLALIIAMPFLFAVFLLLLLYLTSKTRTKVRFNFSTSHWHPEMIPRHGPQSWPLWRVVWFRRYVLSICQPSTGRRLWVYTRWGAIYFDVYFDRRAQVQP